MLPSIHYHFWNCRAAKNRQTKFFWNTIHPVGYYLLGLIFIFSYSPTRNLQFQSYHVVAINSHYSILKITSNTSSKQDQVRFGLAEIYSSGPTTVYTDFCRILGAPPWDPNQDGIVSLLDLVIIAAAYGSTPGSPNWNRAAGINADVIVDLNDLVMFAGHFGEQYA